MQDEKQNISEEADEIDVMFNYNSLEEKLSDMLRDLQDVYFKMNFIENAANEKILNTNRKDMLHCIKMVSSALLTVVERKNQLSR